MPTIITHGQAAPQQAFGKMPSFIKTGEAATESFKQQEAARAAAQEAYGRMWRWSISTKKLGLTYKLIFLDGMLNPTSKMLQNPTWKEHSLKNMRGFYDQYVCTDHGGPGSEPCPICANTQAERATTVMGFTVIDPTPITFTKGDKAGKTVPFSRKLLIAKSKTIPLLQAKALKTGGLRGVCVDVMRTAGTEASVGNVFELDSQYSEEELVTTFGQIDSQSANWDFELGYKTADELIKLGVAAPMHGVAQQSAPSVDYTQGV